MDRQQLQFLLKKYRLEPRRQQGQNFLLDECVVAESIEAAEMSSDDIVLEIGPGFGMLTTALAEKAKHVIAVEQDRDVMLALRILEKQYPNLTVVNEDIRTCNLGSLQLRDREYKLVSNLPYSIGTWVVRQFTEYAPSPELMVVMLQKEVALRVCASPGQLSVLGVAVQCFADAAMIRTVSRESFYPVPEVESALVKITMRSQPRSADPHGLISLAKVGFSSKRKQLHNNLQTGYELRSTEAKALIEDIGLSAEIRPQELSIEDWESLRKALSRTG